MSLSAIPQPTPDRERYLGCSKSRAPGPRRRHPLRRWWVYCFVVWALLSTSVGHVILGIVLTVLGRVWLREVVLIVVVATIAFYVARSLWRTSRKLADDAATLADRARGHMRGRKHHRAFAHTRTQIRRLPQTTRR